MSGAIRLISTEAKPGAAATGMSESNARKVSALFENFRFVRKLGQQSDIEDAAERMDAGDAPRVHHGGLSPQLWTYNPS